MTQKEKISQKISRELLVMIENGKFSPGSKLPTEMELAELFGVSRMPIREALSVLRAMGLISSQQGGGSYVEEVIPTSLSQHFHIQKADEESIRHLFEMRKILEPEAAYLAACRRTPDELERIREVLKWMEHDFTFKDKTGREADFEFHRTIIQATHNSVMVLMLENLSSLYNKALEITLKQNVGLERKREIVYKEHENIFLAIEAEEPELAKVQSLIHLKNVEKKFNLFLNESIS
ncbi:MULTISPECIES: FadR/GntR family transcriptional regulator [Bacillus]|uniref:FadR/GntR family transcriptional regulator n=1 Tax=Bacillus bingmayongensis TaxID=1150157 RepID=A0ABU5JS26_9BACI|nr:MULTISPECIES: FadR/GntR family transcriptional regulator [Bacillus]MBO1581869.1 FadR family transcriptional regulator [Bacillus sp. XF8]MBY0595897.1 FadR family transcriptional regulator [Bacillus bingmayongensis]MDZ5606208.1 FadR/GntR family transcriptional regulator [Bacillus pseudomycoides]